MTSAPGPRPLTQLPPPPPLPADPPALPAEIMLESRRELTGRLMRQVWKPALVLAALWLLLVIGYVQSVSPTMWVLSPLLLGSGPGISLGSLLRMMSLSPAGTLAALVLVPILGPLLSVALVPVAAARIAPLDPRRFLTDRAFRSAVAARWARTLLAPPVAIIALLALAVVAQVPIAWADLSYGVIAGFAGGIGLTWIAALIVRGLLDVPAVLGPEASAHPRMALAQDRRHLPPSGPLDVPRVLLRSLRVTARAVAGVVGVVVLPAAWLVFGIGDAVVVLSRVSDPSVIARVDTGLAPAAYAVGLPLLAVVMAAMAAAPLLAMRLADSRRPLVRDLRTYPDWHVRASLNPWEVRACSLAAGIDALLVAAAAVALAVLLAPFGALDAMAWVWIVLDLLLVAPLVYPLVLSAMRAHLRSIVYGPAERFMRREAPFAQVAPEAGTRAALAADPVVRQRIREARGDRFGLSDPQAPTGGDAPVVTASGLPDFGHEPAEPGPRRRRRAPDDGSIPGDLGDL